MRIQARLACEELLGNYERPADIRAAIKFEMEHPHFKFRRELRHSTEVDYHRFREELRRELKKAEVEIGAPPKGVPSRYKNTPAAAVRSCRAA